MSKRQTELELMRHDCKARFRNKLNGCCTFCGWNIVHDMARHVSSFHLDLGQLWRCPVLWCTQWKGIPQDCIDHIWAKHHVGVSVRTASLGKWFPHWTASRAVVDGVRHIHRRGAVQRAWGTVGSPLLGVRCSACIFAWIVYD